MKRILLASIFIFALSCQKQAPPENKPIGTITSTDGEVLISRTIMGPLVIPAAPTMALYLKDTIETKQGKIKVSLTDETTIALSENSKIMLNEFVIEEDSNFRKSTINMTAGQLRSVVSKHFSGAGSEMNIETPSVIAGIRGTELAITAEEKESAVYCLDGEVEVFKPLERDKAQPVKKDMYTKAVFDQPIAEPKPIPEEIKKLFFEEPNFVPPDFKARVNTFEAEYEAKKAEMKAREMQMKQKMKDQEKQIKEKMKANEDKYYQKQERQKSMMDKKREEMLKKMEEMRKKSSTKKVP